MTQTQGHISPEIGGPCTKTWRKNYDPSQRIFQYNVMLMGVHISGHSPTTPKILHRITLKSHYSQSYSPISPSSSRPQSSFSVWSICLPDSLPLLHEGVLLRAVRARVALLQSVSVVGVTVVPGREIEIRLSSNCFD